MLLIKNGKRKIKMICVLCRVKRVDNLYWKGGILIQSKELVVCSDCRGQHKPGCVPERQYPRYWKIFSTKWRKENKICLKS